MRRALCPLVNNSKLNVNSKIKQMTNNSAFSSYSYSDDHEYSDHPPAAIVPSVTHCKSKLYKHVHSISTYYHAYSRTRSKISQWQLSGTK